MQYGSSLAETSNAGPPSIFLDNNDIKSQAAWQHSIVLMATTQVNWKWQILTE